MQEDLKDAYKTLSDYDRHYSSVRSGLATFLFTLSYGIASFLLKDVRGAFTEDWAIFIASMIPVVFLFAAFFLSCHFQRLTHACFVYMKGIETEGQTQFIPRHARLPDLTQVRSNLKLLLDSRSTDLKTELMGRLAMSDSIDRVHMDLPNCILVLALALILFFPCVTLSIHRTRPLTEIPLWPIATTTLILFFIYLPWTDKNTLRQLSALRKFLRILTPLIALFFTCYTWYICFYSQGTVHCQEKHVSLQSQVGSFLPGVHTMPDSNPSFEKLRNSIADLAKKACLPNTIFVIGSTDRRHLEGRLELAYGDNNGLARARAEYVANTIHALTENGKAKARIITLINGPTWHGSRKAPENEKEMAKDRSVGVFGLWTLDQNMSSKNQGDESYSNQTFSRN